jgi:hypothetical protein
MDAPERLPVPSEEEEMNHRDSLKRALTNVGSACSMSALRGLDTGLNYLWVGNWARARGFKIPKRSDSREQIFEDISAKIGDREVLYLEFGVYGGTSMRQWSKLLRNPKSKLHGFDSFEGLPESWDGVGKGHFDTGGAFPAIDDQRVSFFKGWFSETLPKYSLPSHDVLFVTLDADLYSSTKTVLDFIGPHVSVGTYLYFDEFHFRDHELKAFDEFLASTKRKFDLIATDQGLSRVLFRCVA